MSDFSKMEQAERMQAKYEYFAEYYTYEKDDIDQAERYEDLAARLSTAIARIQYREATKDDWTVFNAAVARRTELDVSRAIVSELD